VRELQECEWKHYNARFVLRHRSGFVGQRYNWTLYEIVTIDPPSSELFVTCPKH
jgi:hypothetical protein